MLLRSIIIKSTTIVYVTMVVSFFSSCSTGLQNHNSKPKDVEFDNLKRLVGAIKRADNTTIRSHQNIPRFYSDIRDVNVAEYPNDNTLSRIMNLDELAPGAARSMYNIGTIKQHQVQKVNFVVNGIDLMNLKRKRGVNILMKPTID